MTDTPTPAGSKHICGSEQTPKGETTPLVCVCDIDIVGACHIHVTKGGVRFIRALGDRTLVLGRGR